MNYTYAGIGSRKTPTEVIELMKQFAAWAAGEDFTLNTGGAKGADTAFIVGATANNGKVNNYLPFPGYNGYRNSMPFPEGDEIFTLARKYHPNWKACSSAARLMHARNCNIVLGPSLNQPVDFIIGWTPGGEAVGGTGQALRLSLDYGIPVCNLGLTNTPEQMINQFKRDILEAIKKIDDDLFGRFKLPGNYYGCKS